MKHIALILAVLSSVLITTVSTQASMPRPLHQSAVAGLLTKAHTLGHVGRATHLLHSTGLRGLGTARSDSAAPSQQSAQSLFLPESAFSPAVKNATYWGTTTAANADQSWFRAMHSKGAAGNYETFGFLQGVYQRADWNTSGTTVIYRYQGSQYISATGALNAYNDGVSFTTTDSGTAAKSCTNNPAVLNCSYFVYSYKDTSGTTWIEEYDVLQVGACLAEITGDVPSTIASAVSAQFVQTMGNLDKAAVTAMANTCASNPVTSTPIPVSTPTPPPSTTDFSVISVRFEKAKAPQDYDLKKAPLTKVKAGTPVQLSIYVNMRSLASGSVTVTRHYRVALNGKTIFNQSSSSAIKSADTYWFGFESYKLSKPGKYTFTGSITVSGKSDQDSAILTAVRKYTAPKKVSFSFTNLQSAASTVHAGQQATLNVDFNVKNLKGHTTGFITRTVLVEINGQWKGISTNTSSTTVLNGANHNIVTTQLNAPGTVRLQVTVTLGSSSQTKTVPITVVR